MWFLLLHFLRRVAECYNTGFHLSSAILMFELTGLDGCIAPFVAMSKNATQTCNSYTKAGSQNFHLNGDPPSFLHIQCYWKITGLFIPVHLKRCSMFIIAHLLPL